MPFTLPALPFAADALSPHMSAETFEYHHGKHHKAYVDKVNGWIEEKQLAGLSLLEVIRAADSRKDMPLFNNAAQIWNHSFFWSSLAPAGSTKPSARLEKLISDTYGSIDGMLNALTNAAVGHFGSGWAWLQIRNDGLEIVCTHDAGIPELHGASPLLTLDLWEHAYYIDYRNARPRFAEEVLHNIVNWDFASRNLDGLGASRADQPAT